MAKAENKTKQTDNAPIAFLSSVENERRREDGLALFELFNSHTGLEPRMWGPSLIGYGRYAYTYESGRSGEFFLTGFSPRKSNLTIYVMPGYAFGEMTDMLERLGKHKLGKSCLYINKLADIDTEVLKEIITFGIEHMRAKYETWDI